MRALISVYDKTGIVEFARNLSAAGYDLISTGGTHQALSNEGGLAVRQVSEVTGSPEILDGRVKTLHPVIHAGLLARRDLAGHQAELEQHKITPIDLVAVNLYPFVATISKPGVTLDDALENIDIGGPTMLRAAAKNFPSVAVVVDPDDYEWVAGKLAGDGLTLEDRRGLAAKAFHHVAVYDAAVTGYLGSQADEEPLPAELSLSLTRVSTLRYGENPHQKGALYAAPGAPGQGIAGAVQLHGAELSYNNLMDADSAWRTVSDFADPIVAIIKHSNPCGLASRDEQVQAYLQAYEGDTVSAFGGIVAFNTTVTPDAAQAMGPVFYEVVVAPGYDPEALETLKKKRNLRILQVSLDVSATAYDLRPITGGILVQTPDVIDEDPLTWNTVTNRAPTAAQLADLAFAWKASKHIKSNAIVMVKDRTLVGMGAGQPNRVVSVHPVPTQGRRQGQRQRACLRRVFPIPGQHRTGRGSRRQRHSSTRRLHPRRGSD